MNYHKRIIDTYFVFDAQITTHAVYLTGKDAEEVLTDAPVFLEMQKYIYNYYNLDRLSTVYDLREKLYGNWSKAVLRSKGWVSD
jgi:hypothetical protein